MTAKDLVELFKKRVAADPGAYTEKLNAVTRALTAATLFKDLNIRFKAFEPKTAGEDVGIGIEYLFDRSLKTSTLVDSPTHPLGLSLNLHAQGNVAFERMANPTSFLETSAKLHLFQTIGGVAPLRLDENSTVDGQPLRERFADELQKRILAAVAITGSPEEVDADPRWKSFMTQLEQVLGNQFFWDFSGHASLESSQDFTEKQGVFGAQLGATLKAWNQQSELNGWNLLDYPFALLRVLTGTDQSFKPSGRTFPTLLIGIDVVSPEDDSARTAAGEDKSEYARFRAEVAFKTKVAKAYEKEVWFSASWRFYQEIGASSAVESADIDGWDYVAMTLGFQNGFNISYSAGRLPLDATDDSVFELGYSLNF